MRMRTALSITILLVAAVVVNAHVIAVYNGLNLAIRGAGNTDETQTTAGPCGDGTGSNVFGSAGVSKLSPGELINLQLKYAQNHRIDGGNTFLVAMLCTSGDGSALNSDTPLRQSVAANKVNRVAINTVNVPDESLVAMPIQLPAKSPAGMTLKDGDFCTISIMDQRDWGGCVDIRITTNPGPIIAGVLAPVTIIGVAAALYFGRNRIGEKLLPASAEAAAPDVKLNQVLRWGLLAMIIAIISCSVPAWSAGKGWMTGPWLYCPSSNAKCSNSLMLGFQAIYAVRFFVISAVLATIFAFFGAIAAYYNRLDSMIASKIAIGCYIYAGISQFLAFMLWVCIFGGGSNPGWCLYFDIVAFAFSFASAVIAIMWMNHIKMAPDTSSTAVSVVTTEPVAKASAPIPMTSTKYTAAAVSSPKTPAAAVAAPEPKYAKKWGQWEEIWDEENQAYYFFNHSNGEAAWDRPAGWAQL